MIANHNIYTTLTASLDTYYFYNSFKDKFDDVSYYNPYNKNYTGKSKELSDSYNALNGVFVKNILDCEIIIPINKAEEIITLNIDMYLFTERSIIFSFTYKFKKHHTIILDKLKNLHENDINIILNGDRKVFNIGKYIFNDILSNILFKMDDEENGLNSIIQNVDPFDLFYNSSDDAHDKTIEKLGLNVDIYGSTYNGCQLTVGSFAVFSILDEEKIINTKNLNKICDDYELYYDKKNNFIVANIQNQFKQHINKLLEYRIYYTIIESYNKNFINSWYSSLEETSNEIINNLNNQNEIFWKKLRTDVEKSQLRFLSSKIRFSKILLQIKKLGNSHIYKKDFRNEFVSPIKKNILRIKDNLKEIKDGLENIATPGHTHDEQLLQKVTEKGNERILLLSFLAMSIPMIGAILSPTLGIQTKLISALILGLLPFTYIIISNISYKRKERKNIKRFLKRGYSELSINLANMNKEKDLLKKNNDEDARIMLPTLEYNIKLIKEMIGKLEKRM